MYFIGLLFLYKLIYVNCLEDFMVFNNYWIIVKYKEINK